ncbi:tail assembly protein [Cupriavidus metallidurans]|uniref:tail assembly protein n=1 Tax=Cupriavidus metallidurans TaxID=119219 RepID=UPI001BFC8E2F|nr:tail assembly protein [Cupriavidus metallidurans]QWC87696.1 tail assembly protein [Cupriavidus metallidurans]
MEKIRTIRLYGNLGVQFGRVHRLAIANAAEAVRALSVLVPGFRAELQDSSERGVAYAVFIGRQNVGHDQMCTPPGGDDIRIAPVMRGAKRAGLFQTILGVALVALAWWNPPALGMTAQMAFGVGLAGASMALGGVVQMLSPQAKGLSTKDSPNNGASYNFNGPVNTTAQGNPVPILYGRMIVGSAVLSGGIFAEDQA